MSNLVFQKWINEGSKIGEYLTKNGNQTELPGAAVYVTDGVHFFVLFNTQLILLIVQL